ncbi:MAG: hypothetical protein AAF629_04525 [Chloroflexota bacterium]
MLEIRRIGVLSVAKVLAAIYACLGIIVGGVFSCAALLGATAAYAEAGPEGLLFLFGVGAIVVMPLTYGVLGFVIGIIVAFIYNLVAGRLGGVEFYTE